MSQAEPTNRLPVLLLLFAQLDPLPQPPTVVMAAGTGGGEGNGIAMGGERRSSD